MKYEEAIERIEYLKNKAEISLINNNASCEWLKKDVEGTITAFSMAIEAMEKQATIQATSEWIPVSERLPDNADEDVLITVNGTYKNITYEDGVMLAVYDKDEGWIIDGYQYWLTAQVTAWHPLPEPYKEREL